VNTTQPPDVPTPAAVPPSSAADFWQPRTLEELAAAQGVGPVARPEDRLGQGTELWADDAEFERFLAWLNESRRAGG
jgi:hypothetical protein